MSDDILEELEEEILYASRKAWDSAQSGLSANFLGRVRGEIERLREENDAWQMDGASAAAEIKKLRAAMHDIYEVYAGSEGFIPQYCSEAYLQGLVKEMADIAAKHKGALKETGNG